MGSATGAGPAPDYVLGSSEAERRRLALQAAIIQPVTQRIFRAARIVRGMRVLDLGSGTGDVSLLAARMVGSAGAVVGIDRDSECVRAAGERARAAGYSNVTFRHESIDTADFDRPFDAVVGRLVLLYQPDPVAAVRRAAGFLRRGGRIAFQEYDLTQMGACWPPAPLFQWGCSVALETFRRSGAHLDMGMRLCRTFLDAGLPAPQTLAEAILGSGPASPVYEMLAQTVISLLPKAEQFGITTREEVQPETLARRIEAEAIASGALLMSPLQIGAWTRKP